MISHGELKSKKQSAAATGDDTVLDCSLGRVHRVVDAVLALLDLDLAVAADADDGDPARQLGPTLLELLAVVIGGRLLQALAKRDGLTRRYIRRLVCLAFLSPDLVEAILQGRQPVELTASRLPRRPLPIT
jgi:hypothetical protein